MSLPDTVFIFALALIIFGPKKLPEIGRQLGKLVLEFRRASNEFKMQIEEELRSADEADRQKKIAAQNVTPAAPAAATADTADTSEALTIRPPSTGTIESAESPFKAHSEQEEPVQTEPTEFEAETASGPREAEAANPEPQEQGPTSAGEPSLMIPGESITGESQKTLGSYERIVDNQERTVSEREDLEEQTAHHHG